jgi:hypothetical protein
MDHEFAAKLRLTAAVLGCTSRKDLCARFRAINPATQCGLDRLHKWLQGRAAPRPGQFYDDWAKLLGSSRRGSWFESCSREAFIEEICALFGVPASDLLAAEPFMDHTAGQPEAPRSGGMQYLAGSYACYSYSWSPYYRDKLLRGGMSLASGRGGALSATYSEAFLGTTMRFEGEGAVAGGALHLRTRDPSAGMHLHFHLFVPGPPASALYGIMSGTTVLRDEPSISAGRFLMIRVPEDADLEGSNGYLDPLPGAIVGDLLALGLAIADRDEVDTLARSLLISASTGATAGEAAHFEQVKAGDSGRLTAALHKAQIERSQARANTSATIATLRRGRIREV